MNVHSFWWAEETGMARGKDSGKPAQILEAAFSVFGEAGYQATVIKDIADRAGISAGTIYTYFHDKMDLFRATAEEGWSRFLQQMRELAASPEPVESRLARFLDLGFGSLRQYLPLLRGMLFESSQMNILQNGIDEFCALVGRILDERGRDARQTIDPSFHKTFVRTTVVGVLFSAAMAKPDRVDEEIDDLKRTVTLLLAGG
jgi:AcrR family transcriptional regulator